MGETRTAGGSVGWRVNEHTETPELLVLPSPSRFPTRHSSLPTLLSLSVFFLLPPFRLSVLVLVMADFYSLLGLRKVSRRLSAVCGCPAIHC